MRRPSSALIGAALVAALSVPMTRAQQLLEGSAPANPQAAPAAAEPLSPARGARHLLHHGMDYLEMREYEKALSYFREAESRLFELNEPEKRKLTQGIQRAQRGMRGDDGASAMTLAAQGLEPRRPALDRGVGVLVPEPVQLTSASRIEPDSPSPVASANLPELFSPPDLPPLPNSSPLPPPALDPGPPPSEDLATVAPPDPLSPAPPDAPAPLTPETEDLASPAAVEPAPEVLELPPTPAPADLPPPAAALAPTLVEETIPPLPPESASPVPDPMPAVPGPALELPTQPEPMAEPEPVAEPEPAAIRVSEGPSAAVPTPTALEESDPMGALPPLPEERTRPVPALASNLNPWQPRDPEPYHSTLSPELQEEVERKARLQDQERIAYRQDERNRFSGDFGMPGFETDPTMSSIALPRAASPTEARPLRPVPPPEEAMTVTIPWNQRRSWAPNRKYWSAAAPCHMPLYFQDAVLERYGQSVEQAFGPFGRCLSYPLDDPTQSLQRNQVLQPFYSIGLFATQIAFWPYNLVMNPPWEAEYDLGYQRPGDPIPPDTIYLPPFGYGPPLRGSHY